MGQVKVTTATVRKKNTSKPQPKVQARRVVVNNQVKKLHTAAASSKRSSSPSRSVSKSKVTASSKTVSRSTLELLQNLCLDLRKLHVLVGKYDKRLLS